MSGWNVTRDYDNETRLEGVISHVFGTPKPDWTAGVIKATNGDPLAQGCRFRINDLLQANQKVTLIGHWNNDPKWGWQFVAECIELPELEIVDKDGLAEYLANDDDFKKIGPVKAKLIAEEFGDNFDEVIRNEPDRIAEIAKLSLDDVLNIQEVWCERADVNAISTWLASFGVTASQIRRIAKVYGNLAKQKIEQNPYCLCVDITGIGFLTNDKIALQMGIDPLCEYRLKAGIMHIINDLHEQGGHTYVPLESLIRETIKSLYLDALNSADLVREQVDNLVDARSLALVNLNDGDYVGAAWLRDKELYLLERFQNNEISGESSIQLPEVLNIELTDEQKQAVENAINNKISVITGGAGVGKSYTIKAILDVFRSNELSVAICTPTGKAARRLQADGVFAQTIHRTLEYNPYLGGFSYHELNKLPVDAVIVDEVSMCSVPLLWDLFQALDSQCRIILVGDHNQLPPIGPGNTLKDLCEHNIVPVSYLTKCHRNAGKLKENCQATLRGILPRETVDIDVNILPKDFSELNPIAPQWSVATISDDYAEVIDLLYILHDHKLQEWGYDPLLDVQVISPQRPGPLGVDRINLILQWINQNKLDNSIPFPEGKQKMTLINGDKVMQIRNNYNFPHGLMNGTQGVIKDQISIDEKCGLRYECPNNYECANCEHRKAKETTEHLLIQFDDRDELLPISLSNGEADELTLAYAVTVHKVQGSQYPCVIAICSKAHTYMLSRNLIYTAVTRSRISCIVLGDSLGMKRAVSTLKDMSRNTWTALYAQEQIIKNQECIQNNQNNNEVALVG